MWVGHHQAIAYPLEDVPDLRVELGRDPVQGSVQSPPPLPLAVSVLVLYLPPHWHRAA